jgi:succinoglycan biosynthesis protein ExoM
MQDASSLEVSVVVPTFRRPALLPAALESLLSQRDLTFAVEVIVVDNDPQCSARQLVMLLAESAPLSLRYVAEPRAGISHARNAGVAAAAGRYVAFLDDDEAASPRWLANLLATAQRCQADIVVGPVLPLYPKDIAVPHYARRIYHKDARLQTGAPVRWTSTGNALLRRDRCLAMTTPFDPRLGLSGGEDSCLFAILRERGRRFVWCAEATVTEVIPPAKLRPGYLIRRAFRGGQTTAYVPSMLSRPQWRSVLRWMTIGAAQVCVYAPWSIFLVLVRREEWLTAMAKAASGLGKVLWHPALHIRNYRLTASPGPTRRPR